MEGTYSFSLTPLHAGDPLPLRDRISTVFLVGFLTGGKIIAIRNERGWDLPGGHLKKGEHLLDGLRREVLEESGAEFDTAMPFCILSSSVYDKLVIGFVSHSCTVHESYDPIDDALERALMTHGELVEKYFGDKQLIQSILRHAAKVG